MKPFFGFDLTHDKNKDEFNGEVFLVQKPSDETKALLEGSSDQADAMEERSKLPLGYRILKGVCGFFGLIFVAVLLRLLLDGEVTLAQGYSNAPWVFWIGISCVILWVVLFFKGREKLHEAVSSEEFAKTEKAIEESYDTLLRELDVPSGAVDIDVFMFFYRVKEGKIQTRSRGLQLFEYFNLAAKAWSDGEYLYLVRVDGKFAFPLAELTDIRTVRKRTIISGWNKDVAPDKGEYKQYKLAVNDYGGVICRCYHILALTHGAEEYGIYFPPYELPVIETLTGLHVSEDGAQDGEQENDTKR